MVLNDPANTMNHTGVVDATDRLTTRHNGRAIHRYEHALKGFSVRLTEPAAIELSNNSEVKYVEENSGTTATLSQSPTTWGLDRLDQVERPLDNTYNDKNLNGAGVNVYVLDTGIRTAHTEFGDHRASASAEADFIYDGLNGQDGNGHGTHVAATIGGTTYGVAKQVRLYSVRVLDSAGHGTVAGAIAGIDWITQNHVGVSAANMSLSSSVISQAMDDAIKASVAAGTVYVVAAGNSNLDASTISPAHVAEAITVAATDKTDTRASFSNYGASVDLFAPGVAITSAWNASDTAINTISGTSMAAPHVCGMAARYLQDNPTATPADVQAHLVNIATINHVPNSGTGTPNRLACILISLPAPTNVRISIK